MNILIVGDINGKAGRRAVKELLPVVKKKFDIDFCVANAENAAGGFGLTSEIASKLFSDGVDVITMGNHTWDNKELEDIIDYESRILRPLNYSPGNPGSGSVIIDIKNTKIAVINLTGRVFMGSYDCPFRAIEAELKRLKECNPMVIVDFHAEATSEKIALGWFLDGKVSAIIGTHTHVQTADETILPCGTAYITDVGMTGAHDSVIGIKKELAIKKFLTQMPVKFEVASDDVRLNALFVQVNPTDNKAEKIVRIQEKLTPVTQ
ncbi:MAG: TIGR00282 family metallophosphoesterase [bacterium]|nr:TIGR00282 family metallophosphoesterase [bacterium]